MDGWAVELDATSPIVDAPVRRMEVVCIPGGEHAGSEDALTYTPREHAGPEGECGGRAMLCRFG